VPCQARAGREIEGRDALGPLRDKVATRFLDRVTVHATFVAGFIEQPW
jgi:hypothetical protein